MHDQATEFGDTCLPDGASEAGGEAKTAAACSRRSRGTGHLRLAARYLPDSAFARSDTGQPVSLTARRGFEANVQKSGWLDSELCREVAAVAEASEPRP